MFIITYQIKVLSNPGHPLPNTVFSKLKRLKKCTMRLQRSYDDDVKQHGERGSTCDQEREQTGDNTLTDAYTSYPPD